MRGFGKVVTLFMVLALFVAVSHAAEPKEASTPDEGVYLGEYKQGIPLGDLSGDGGISLDEGGRTAGKIAPFDNKLPTFEIGKEKGKQTPDYKTTQPESPQKKAKITLKAEPGDGLIGLSWRVTGVQQKPGDQPLKFTIF
ncbi:MAG TPA: hypothetical protein VI389_12305, partial [Geobacteraceae bacterium]